MRKPAPSFRELPGGLETTQLSSSSIYKKEKSKFNAVQVNQQSEKSPYVGPRARHR